MCQDSPCIYKHTCGFDYCNLTDCPCYIPKNRQSGQRKEDYFPDVKVIHVDLPANPEILSYYTEREKMDENKWIPVSERLPEVEQYTYSVDVLFVTDDFEMYVGYVNVETGRWKTRGAAMSLSTDRVTHWMPLPELPKEGVE